MCGRFTSLTPPEELAEIFSTAPLNPQLFDEFQPNFNVPPTTRITAVAQDAQGIRKLGRFQWGLVPTWAKDASGSARCINARSETVHEKPSFRSSVPTKRCIIPMDGFYEWQTIGITASSPPKPKQPVYVTRRDGNPLAVAGLWASWRDRSLGDSAPWLHSCCVITTQANDTMSPIHDRMPVILEAQDWDDWLNVGGGSHTATQIQRITELMIPADPLILIPQWVSTAVNSVRNNHAELVLPIEMPS